MKKNRIELLTSVFLEKGLNVKEQDELKVLLQDSEMHDYFKQAYMIWNASSLKETENIEFSWQKLLFQINQAETDSLPSTNQHSTPRRRINWVSMVAASCLAFVLGMSVYYFAFDSNQNLLFKHGNSRTDNLAVTTKVNRITVPLGSKSQIDLPDGTSVALNAGSQLTYTTDYGQQVRKVNLEGEAYFKVAKNPECPFIVIAKNTSIKALGTEFNVKAYKEEDIVQTTLVEGLVSIDPNINVTQKVDDIVLKPNQMVTVHKDDSQYAIHSTNKLPGVPTIQPHKDEGITLDIKDTKVSMQTVNPILYTSWKDKRWIIEGEEMESLALKLQRRYDVSIIIASPELRNYKFSGILENETLEQMLDIMQTIAPVNSFVDKKTVVFSVNQKQRKAFDKSMK